MRPGIPPLIYPWRIDRILAERTPRVLKTDERVGGYVGPDETREAWIDVTATDTCSQLDYNYLLECTRIGEASKERLLVPPAAARQALGIPLLSGFSWQREGRARPKGPRTSQRGGRLHARARLLPPRRLM